MADGPRNQRLELGKNKSIVAMAWSAHPMEVKSPEISPAEYWGRNAQGDINTPSPKDIPSAIRAQFLRR